MSSKKGSKKGSKRGRGQRGPSKCDLNFNNADDYVIEFDENGKPDGVNASKFISWFSMTVNTRLSYH